GRAGLRAGRRPGRPVHAVDRPAGAGAGPVADAPPGPGKAARCIADPPAGSVTAGCSVEFLWFLTLKGSDSTAQGRRFGAPWVRGTEMKMYPEGVRQGRPRYNPFGVGAGCGIGFPGCAARPWALEYNPLRG